MQTVCTIYLVRHGESTANRDGLASGYLDSPLSPRGQEQARETKQLLADVHFDSVYSSDLSRASETAAIIYGSLVPKDHQLPDLRERNLGKLEGASIEQWFAIDRAYEKQFSSLPLEQRWNHEYADFVEGDKALYARVARALQHIAQDCPGQTVLVVNHGGPIRILLTKLGYANFLPAGSFKNAGYVVLISDGTDFEIKKAVGVQRPSGSE